VTRTKQQYFLQSSRWQRVVEMVEQQQDTVVQMRDSKKMIDERKTGLLNQVEQLDRSTRYGTGGYAAYIFFSIESLLNLCMTGRLLHFLSCFIA